MLGMKVKDYMTTEVVFVSPDVSLRQAGEQMTQYDCGFLPVGTKDQLAGVITDRDIVTRAVCIGKNVTDERVKNYMSRPVVACNEEDNLKDALAKMHDNEVSRLVVKNKKGQVTGVLSFGGLLTKQSDPAEAANIIKHTFGGMLRGLMA